MIKAEKHLILLLLILIAGAALRIYHLDHSGIWLDEKISLSESNGFTYLTQPIPNYFTTTALKQKNTFENVVKATIKDDGGNGLLYIFKLHYWQQLFGSSDFALRMLSLLFGCLMIIASYYFALNIFKTQLAAMTTALLIAVHPMLIAYSQEVRPYSMATFFALLSSWFYYRSFVQPRAFANFKINVIAFGFCCACALFTHYLTSYVFLAQGLHFLVFVRGKKLWVAFILSWLTVISIFSLWLLNGGLEGLQHMNLHNAQYTQQLNSLKEGENPFLLHANFKNIFLGWLQLLLAAAGNTLQQGGYRLRQIAVLLVIPILLVLIGFKKREHIHFQIKMFLVGLVLAAPLYATVLALIAGHTISFQPAYGIFAAPYIMMAVALGLEKLMAGNYNVIYKIMLTGGFTFIIICSLVIRYTNNSRTYSKDYSNPLALLAEKLTKETAVNDTIAYSSFQDAVITNIYLPENFKSIQMIDTNLHECVVSRNSNKILLDMGNGKFRY